jgi:hypothetical protein
MEASTGVKTRAAPKRANTTNTVNGAKLDREADRGWGLDIKLSSYCTNDRVMFWLSNSPVTVPGVAFKQREINVGKRPNWASLLKRFSHREGRARNEKQRRLRIESAGG